MPLSYSNQVQPAPTKSPINSNPLLSMYKPINQTAPNLFAKPQSTNDLISALKPAGSSPLVTLTSPAKQTPVAQTQQSQISGPTPPINSIGNPSGVQPPQGVDTNAWGALNPQQQNTYLANQKGVYQNNSSLVPGATPNSSNGLVSFPSALQGVYGAANGQAVQQATQNLRDLQDANARATAHIETTTEPLEQMQGQEGVLQRLYASKLANAQGALTNALTSQGQQIGVAENVAGLVQPQQGATFFGSPVTGGIVGQGAGSITNPVQAIPSYADMVVSGQKSYEQAASELGASLTPSLNAAIQAKNPSFNIPQATGQAAASALNAQLAGTSVPQAANSVYQKSYSDYQDLSQNVQNVDQFGTLLTSGMTDKNGNVINPTDLRYANIKIADLRNQINDAQQGQFDSTYAALKSKISGMLAVGGSETPTALTNDASAILNGSAPLGTLSAVLQRIKQEGGVLLQTQAKKVNDALSTIQQGTNGISQGGTPFTSSVSGVTYKLPY